MSNILVVTGDLNQDYMILDSVFAIDSHKGGFLTVADPAKAFSGVKDQLRKRAAALGGDAVINCMFEYRVSLEDGLIGKKQVMEIFAYGTAVKRIQQISQPVAQATPVAAPAPVAPAPAPIPAAPVAAAAPAYSPTPTMPPPAAPAAPAPGYSATPTFPPPGPQAPVGMPSVDDIL